MSEILFQSKLKRLKISYKKQGNTTLIGKPKIDTTTLFGLVFLPLVLAGIAFIIMINSGVLFGKAIILIIGLVGVAIFNFGRIGKKLRQNNSLKTLEHNSLKITLNKEIKKFDNKNSVDLYYKIRDIKNGKDIIYEGIIFLKDLEGNEYQIMGFDEEDEKLLKDDLNWIINYLKNYLNLK